VDPVVVVTAFVTVFVAELPDKTMVASMILSSRYRHPFAVWVGASGAFVVQASIAVAAGGLLNLVPDRFVSFATAVLFAVGAVLLWRESSSVEDEEHEVADELDREAADDPPSPGALSPRAVALRSFAVVFVAEFGDLTQLATASLAARTGQPFAVLLGAAVALCAVAGIAVVAGRAVLRVLPVVWVRRIAALVFACLAVFSLVEGVRG
jgi:putative Ca2+/H+ antiporter (TMEM165/GDT1 family)